MMATKTKTAKATKASAASNVIPLRRGPWFWDSSVGRMDVRITLPHDPSNTERGELVAHLRDLAESIASPMGAAFFGEG